MAIGGESEWQKLPPLKPTLPIAYFVTPPIISEEKFEESEKELLQNVDVNFLFSKGTSLG